MDKELFLKLYKRFVRTHTDYGNSIWYIYPVKNNNKQAIKNLQCQATKIVPEIKDLSYEERLRELNLPTLEYRRRRGDLTQILHSIDDIDSSKIVILNENLLHCLR